VTLTDDPRLLARYDGSAGRWRITQGTYRVALGKSAEDLVLTADALGRAAIRKLMSSPLT
jgi:beta-glucosidase